MYTEYYGLKEKPFNLVPNPAYLYLSSRHEHALTYLEYGLKERIGFIMLTGEIGMGKTTLVRHILNTVEEDMEVAVVFNTNVVLGDLLALILSEFEIEVEKGAGRAEILDALYRFLIKKYSEGRRVLLVIDEAQNLSDDILEEIRMLSNLQTDDELLLQIMIVGQPELREKVKSPRLEQFAQRIAVSYHLSAMTADETCEYISHRLGTAGCSREVFDSGAVGIIYEASGGIPRIINHLCDACLVYGFADDASVISPEIITQVIEDKGGMGIFTHPVGEAKPIDLTDVVQRNMLERLDSLEKKVGTLHSYVTKKAFALSQMEIRKRDELIAKLKARLGEERARYDKLSKDHARLKAENKALKSSAGDGTDIFYLAN